jgi:hypothetical protein
MKTNISAMSHEPKMNTTVKNVAQGYFFQHMAELLEQLTDVTDTDLRDVVRLAQARTKADLTNSTQ